MSMDPPIQGPYPTALPSYDSPDASRGAFANANPDLPPEDPQAKAKQDLVNQYAPLIKSVQDRRRKVEEEWLRNLAAWKAKHGANQGFKGEWFNHYVPAARRAVERFVTRCKQMLFPSPDFFEVYPQDEARPDLGKQAEAWKNLLLWRLNRIKIRSIMSQALRCFSIYQRAIIKDFMDFEEIPGQVWPSTRAVDPFMFYLWPETASEESQVRFCFENTMIPYARYKGISDQGAADPIAPTDLTRPEWPYFYTERLGRQGFTVPTDVRGGPDNPNEPEPQKMVSITEVWRKDGATWTQFWVCWNVTGGPKCTRISQGQLLPYHMAFARQLPGENYTNGMMNDLEALNGILNDTLNMTLEGQAVSILPPAVIDPNRVERSDSLVFKPRAKWLAEPDAVKWMDTPQSSSLGAGYQGMQMIMGMMDSFSGSNPIAEGQPTRGMPRAGFAVSSMLGLSMSDIREVAEVFEDNILSPMLQGMYRMVMTSPTVLQQVGQMPGSEVLTSAPINMADLQSGKNFRWVGSLQFQDQNVRAQRMLTLLGQFAKLYPAMQKSGYDINFGVLGKKMWRDALGERGADSLIVQSPPPQPPPPHSEPPKISVSLSGQITPEVAQQLAISGEPQMQPPPPPQGMPPGGPRPAVPGPPNPNAVRGPGTGGAEAPAPVSGEQVGRQMGRQMAEGSVGKMLAGMGQG